MKIGITHGDINGIGYEVIIKALSAEGMKDICTTVIYGSAKLMAYYKKVLNAEDFQVNQVSSAMYAKDGVVNLVNISDEEFKVEMGEATAEGGRAALMSLEMATDALRAGEIDALVTAPINKHAIHGSAFPFAGHTEYLAAKLAEDSEDIPEALMLLYSEEMKIALATTHLPLSAVSGAISSDLIKKRIRQINETLTRDFGVSRPRIAVLGLNPHSGDNGTLGDEELTIIGPAIKESFDEGILAFGPYAADGFFGSAMYRKFDAILAMYHDQGLAPFKLLCAEEGVNYTACLPYVRTSPDHGTAYDIVGKNIADAESMRHAIFEAMDITRRRRIYDRASANPLRKQVAMHVEKGDKKGIKEIIQTEVINEEQA